MQKISKRTIRRIEKLLEAALTEETVKIKWQVGTIVEILDVDNFEAEFSNDKGEIYSLIPLKSSQLIQPHFKPSRSKRAYA